MIYLIGVIIILSIALYFTIKSNIQNRDNLNDALDEIDDLREKLKESTDRIKKLVREYESINHDVKEITDDPEKTKEEKHNDLADFWNKLADAGLHDGEDEA